MQAPAPRGADQDRQSAEAVAIPRERLLSSIQTLRAIAAWLVVLHHYSIIFKVSHPSWWRQLAHDHGAIGVDIFFVISGFVMALSAGDPAITPRVFVAKRVGRIVPAYWLYTLLLALLITQAPVIMSNWGYSRESLVKSLLFIPVANPTGIGLYPINTVGWTLNLEMVFYLIVAVALFAQPARRGLWITTGIIVLRQLLSPLGIVSELYGDSVLYEFLMGIAVASLWQRGALRGPAWMFGGLSLVAISLMLHPPVAPAVRPLDLGLPALLLVCGCLGLERHFARHTMLVHLGNHSYSVYLIHAPVLSVGWYAAHTLRWNPWLVSSGCFAAIALGGAASYQLLERPAGRWVTRWLLPRGSR